MTWSMAGLASGDGGLPSDYPTEAADGSAHLTYFAEDTSFVWSGSAERPIQVCPGGYGEPVTDVIWPDWMGYDPGDRALPTMLVRFRQSCDEYLRGNR
jgi:hypothetical protein